MTKTKILIADDHSLVRMGLSLLIAHQKDMELVGEAENGQAAVEQIRRLRPDVVIMDLMMPVLSGAEATKIVHTELPDVKIVILTSFGTSADLSQAISDGAAGVILKDSATKNLVEAIHTVAAGETYISAELLRMAEEDAAALQLTEHQKAILASVVRGLTNADIAKQFGVSENTIRKATSTIFSKLGVANRTEATALALRKQLIKS